jgi:hypothetical protein
VVDSSSLAGHPGKAFLLERNGEVAAGLRIAQIQGIFQRVHPTDPPLVYSRRESVSVQIYCDLYGTMPHLFLYIHWAFPLLEEQAGKGVA